VFSSFSSPFQVTGKKKGEFKHAIIEEAHHILLRRMESERSIVDIILREIRSSEKPSF